MGLLREILYNFLVRDVKKLSPDFFKIISSKFKKDPKDAEQRKQMLDNAISAYLKKLKAKPQGDESIYEDIYELAQRFEENYINPIEIYMAAYDANPSEKRFLRIIVNDIVRRNDFCSSTAKYIKAMAEIEENCFPYLGYLIKCYTNNNEQDNVLITYETLYSKIQLFRSKLETGEKMPPDLQLDSLMELEIQAIGYLCEAYINFNRLDDDAVAIYQIVHNSNPENIYVIKQLVKKYLLDKRKDEEAVGMYEMLLAFEPENRELILFLCEAYDNLKRFGDKISLLQTYLVQHENDYEVLNLVVEYYLANRMINTDTIKYIKLFFEKNPDSKNILSEIAEYYAGQSDISKEAIDIYEKVLANSKASLTIRFLLGRYYLEKKSWRDVIRIYEGVREIIKDSSEAIIPLATAYAQYNRFDADALKLYERALNQGSRNETIANILCREYFNKHRRDARTIKIFRDVLALHPKNFFARLGMCEYYEHLAQYSTAIDEAIDLLKQSPSNEDALKILTRALTAFDFPDEVEKIRILPRDMQKKALGEVYVKRQKSKTIVLALSEIYLDDRLYNNDNEKLAEDVLKSALLFKPEHVPYLSALSDIAYKKGARLQGINFDKQIYYICKKELSTLPAKKNFRYPEIFSSTIERLSNYYLDSGKTDLEAEEVFIACYSMGKKNSQLILTLAEIFMRKLSTSLLAMEVYQLALKETSYNPMLEKLLLSAQIENNRFEPVLDYLKEQLQNKNKSPEVFMFTREFLNKSPETPLSLVTELEKIYKENPEDLTLVALLSKAYLKKKKYDKEAAEIFEKALKDNPEDKDLLAALAKTYEQAGEHVKSTEIFEKVITHSEHDPNITLQLAKNYLRKNQKTRQVLEVVKQAISLDPYDMELQMFLLDLFFEHGLKKEALIRVHTLVRDFPELRPTIIEKLEKEKAVSTWDVELFLTLAYLYIDETNFDQALVELNKLFVNFKQHYGDLMDAYNKILTLDPNHSQARIERAILFKLAGDFKEAIHDLEALDDDLKHNPNVLYEFAEIYSSYLNTQKDPEYKLMESLGLIYFELNEYDKCIETFQRMTLVDAYKDKSNFYIARAFHKKESYDLALDYYEKIDKTKEVKECLYEIGDAFYATRNLKKAVRAFNLIISSDIGFRDVKIKVKELNSEIEAEGMPEQQKIFQELSARAQQRFEIAEKIGSGNMGIVYKAYDKELDEIVALKILPQQFSSDPNAVARFRQEAKAARKLSHINIVRIHDIGEEQGRKYISMEYVDGGDLRQRLVKEKKLSLADAVSTSIQIADALSYAHRMNILHRDIKPANILLTSNGEAKLSDFGIASIIANTNTLDTSGLIIGTPMYMSPEQTEGQICGPSSDIYSLGIVMFEMISGSPPFTVGNIAYHHLFSKPPSLIDVNADFVRIILKCLEKKPDNRFRNMEEVAQELRKITQ